MDGILFETDYFLSCIKARNEKDNIFKFVPNDWKFSHAVKKSCEFVSWFVDGFTLLHRYFVVFIIICWLWS